jgi:hypothetical protein
MIPRKTGWSCYDDHYTGQISHRRAAHDSVGNFESAVIGNASNMFRQAKLWISVGEGTPAQSSPTNTAGWLAGGGARDDYYEPPRHCTHTPSLAACATSSMAQALDPIYIPSGPPELHLRHLPRTQHQGNDSTAGRAQNYDDYDDDDDDDDNNGEQHPPMIL